MDLGRPMRLATSGAGLRLLPKMARQRLKALHGDFLVTTLVQMLLRLLCVQLPTAPPPLSNVSSVRLTLEIVVTLVQRQMLGPWLAGAANESGC